MHGFMLFRASNYVIVRMHAIDQYIISCGNDGTCLFYSMHMHPCSLVEVVIYSVVLLFKLGVGVVEMS